MAEYIERGLLLEKLQERDLCLCVSEADIKELPAADVTPVVHGRWIDAGGGYVACSECGEEHGWEDYRASYCEDCGAKMDKEATDEFLMLRNVQMAQA